MNKTAVEEAYRKIAARKKGSKPEYAVIMKNGKPALVFEAKKEKEG